MTPIPHVLFAFLFFTLTLAIAGYHIQSLPYDEKDEARIHDLRLKNLENEKYKSDKIEELIIKHKINPIAARCAIMGWEYQRDIVICREVGFGSIKID